MTELLALGASHKTAPLAMRERIALLDGGAGTLVAELTAQESISEAVALSTCNRTELYLVVSDPVEAEAHVLALLARRANIRPTELMEGMYSLRNCDAARHLYRVTSGLESMIVGEAEVQGQVKRAYELALAARTTGPLTNKLFRAALATGKRVRTDTTISAGRASVASVAVDAARSAIGDLADRHVLIVGAGETAELTAQALHHQGVNTMFVANRRRERAIALAQRFGGASGSFDELPAELERADIVISSTASPHTLLGAEEIAEVMRARDGRPLLLMDLAVPRDIDADCATLDGVTLLDMDGLQRSVQRNLGVRRAEALRAEAIVEEEIQTFARWLGSLEVLPTIAALRAHGDAVVDALLKENAGRWEALGEADRERVELLARTVVKRLLHEPTARVKGLEPEQRHARLQLLRELFGLEEAAAPAEPEAAPAEVPPAAGTLTPLRIGTRGSALALVQARAVAAALPVESTLVEIATEGDVNRALGDKSRWTGALERALVASEIDLAVHSAKDVPGELADGTEIAAAPERANAFDVLVGRPTLEDVPEGARVGTSALRRRAQLLAARPDLVVSELRGNVDTRLRKLAAGEADVLVLAAAGLERLDRGGEAGGALTGEVFVPAPGQGVIAVQARSGSPASEVCAAANHAPTMACLAAERAVVRRFAASCHTPVGVHAEVVADGLRIRGFVGLPDGSAWLADELPDDDGEALAARMLAAGAADLLRDAEAMPHVSGIVHLVGAGPGDPGLLTVRAVELIAAADVILYDRLIPPTALEHARDGAELIYVGKQGDGPQFPQEETHRLLVEHARGGRRVVRLKGGDPFVFGRGGEEALVCREVGIAFEVVPGVTAGVAAPAYAGIPVTHRELASGVAFVTGHEDPAKPESALDWDGLAAFPGTLVFYMGVRALPRIAERLVAGGRAADEPVAVVERGTMPGQKTVLGTLADIAERASGLRAPAITLVGPVAALREQLAWLEARPLHGRTIAVTRARAQASALAARLRELGADVVEAPSIRVRPLDVAAPDLGAYDLVCVTSPNGAERLLDLLRDARELAGITVAAIGPGTTRALRARGVEPDVVPERAVAEGLVEALRDVPVERALIARAAEGRDVLPDALRERGAEVDLLALYETVAEPLDDATRAAAAAADDLLFTSASSVRFYVAAGGTLEGPRLASIGPATSAELRAHGAEPDLEADPHTPDGLVEALLRG